MMELRFTCRYPKCNEPVWKNTINTKYCLEHKRIRNIERRKLAQQNRKMKRIMENGQTVQCLICENYMTRKQKYCSRKCQTKGLVLSRKKKNAINIINKKISDIQELLELIK